MSETIQSDFIRRLRFTPLRDLIRGRISGRLDIKSKMQGAALPDAAQLLVMRVVRCTRLWRIEKIEVADELIAHFYDGIESGATIDDLLKSFGNERQAAKLIRRAKKRNRPLIWHVMRALAWTFACTFLVYLILGVVFLVGQPSPAVNYVDLLNEKTLQSSPDQLAWPIYRQAFLSMDINQFDSESREQNITDAKPGGKHWAELKAWLEAHGQTLELIRQAAGKPILGFVVGPGGSINDPELFPMLKQWQAEPYVMLSSVLLPHLNMLQTAARVLIGDMRLAQVQNDSPRFISDATALIHMADQMRLNDVLITDLFALRIRSGATLEIDHVIAQNKLAFSQSELQQLAHILATADRADQLISFRAERFIFLDAVQRMYTDDGHGSGRLTPAGVKLMPLFMSPNSKLRGGFDDFVLFATLAGPLAGSRRQIIEEYNHFMDQAESVLHNPIREANWTQQDQEREEWKASPTNQARFTLLTAILPGLSRAHSSAERWLGQRDGLIVGIALESYRQQHGSYPDSLDILVPTLLPKIPTDRMTGAPVHYRLINSKPVIYGFGPDRDDDGGRAPANKHGTSGNLLAAEWNLPADQIPDGDWILYPQPIDPDEPPE